MKKNNYKPTAQDKFNNWVLSDLSPENMVSLRDSILSGETYLVDQLYRTMIARWSRLRKCLEEKGDKVESLAYSIIPWADRNEKATPESQAMADFIEDALFHTEAKKQNAWQLSFSELLNSITYALARGCCVFQIRWQYDKVKNRVIPQNFKPVLPTFYGWATQNNEPDRLLFYPKGFASGRGSLAAGGEEFPKDEFLIAMSQKGVDHPLFNAQLYALVGYFGASMYGLKWFMNYTEVFGAPIRQLKVRTEEDLDKAEQLMEDYGNSSWIAVTKDMELILHSATGGADMPQDKLIKLADEQCTELILGQTLTSSQGERGSQSLGTVHSTVRDDFLMSAAKFAVNIINTQLIPAIIRRNFGDGADVSQLPRLDCKMQGKKYDIEKLRYVKEAKDAGIQMSEQYVYDFLELPLPEEGTRMFKGNMTNALIDDIAAARAEARPKLAPSPQPKQ